MKSQIHWPCGSLELVLSLQVDHAGPSSSGSSQQQAEDEAKLRSLEADFSKLLCASSNGQRYYVATASKDFKKTAGSAAEQGTQSRTAKLSYAVYLDDVILEPPSGHRDESATWRLFGTSRMEGMTDDGAFLALQACAHI